MIIEIPHLLRNDFYKTVLSWRHQMEYATFATPHCGVGEPIIGILNPCILFYSVAPTFRVAFLISTLPETLRVRSSRMLTEDPTKDPSIPLNRSFYCYLAWLDGIPATKTGQDLTTKVQASSLLRRINAIYITKRTRLQCLLRS